MAGFRRLFLLFVAVLGQVAFAFTTTTDPWYRATTDRGWGSRWPYASTEGTTSDWRYQMSSGSSYGCGTKHSNSLSGYITSPNYPGKYFNNAHCEYIIDPGTYVYLHVVDKDLESCCDHLVIYDQRDNNVTDTDYLYGRYFRVVFTSDGSDVFRGFKLYYGPDYSSFPAYLTTDSSYNRRSSSPYPWNGIASTHPWYRATTDRGWGSRWPYASTEGTTSDWRYQMSSGSSYGCGTKHSNSLSGYITSPNYPGKYFNNAHCEYIIDPGTYVYLHVVDKDLESCCDHLVIYDQRDNNVTDTDYLYGRYFRVVFTSDGSDVFRGFKLYYGPDYSSFPAYLSTDSSYNRRSSSPYPWNGIASTYPWYRATTDRGWGSRWPYASTEGTTSDWRYQMSSGSSYGCGTKPSNSLSGYITSPNYPGKYFNNAHCEYIIDPGTYVYLHVVDKDLESCCDHLVIYDQRDNNVTDTDYLYGRYFRVVFTSDGSDVFRGFKLYYGPDYSSFPAYLSTDSSYNRRSSSPYPWNGIASTYPWYRATTDRGWGSRWPYASTEGTTSDWRYQMSSGSSYGCGTKHSNSLSGYITSPNYPGKYFNNAHCEYIIDPGTYVYLHVVDKDLESCCDHLVIYDQRDNNVTDTDYLYGRYFRVVFTSDGSDVFRGFKLYYGPDYSSFPAYLSTDSSYNRRSSSPYPWNGIASTHPWYRATTDKGWGSRWSYASTEGTTSDWRYQTSSGYDCGDTSYSTSGVFQSPNYPSNYSNNLYCVYRIYPSYNIELRIDHLMLEQNYDFLGIVYTDVYGYRRNTSYTGTSRDTMVGTYFEITFTTDRSNTDQGFILSWRRYDSPWGSTTNGYYQPSSPWWGWTSQAPPGNVMVTCDSRNFKVTVPRDMIQQVFPGSSPYDLTLDDPNCRGQVYYDVVMFRSSILGCGMTREETGYDIVYKNRIMTQVRGYYGTTATTGSIITRFNSKDITLECHLNRDVSIIGHFRPQHDHQLVASGTGNFSMHMDFYRDPSMIYRITSYPMYIGLNQDVYVDVGLESDDSDLKISLQKCVAKPTVDPYDYYNQYYLIRDGCPADQTVAFEYTSSLKHVHFRFRTFEFVRNNRDVYIFCYVRVCNATDYEHRCRRDCNSIHRRVREASDEQTNHDLHIFQGPLTFREKRNADFQVAERTGGNDSSTTAAVPAIVMAIAAVAMVMAAVVMVIRGKRRNRSHTKGVDTEL